MNKNNLFHYIILLLAVVTTTAYAAEAEIEKNLFSNNSFTIGIGAAIVEFDTKLKFTDKTRSTFDSIFIFPEGTLAADRGGFMVQLYTQMGHKY